MKELTHDQLQFRCFWHLHNNHPELRKLFWGTFNDIKTVESILGNIGNRLRMIILSKMKSLGMVKGVVDFMFYYAGCLHVMDFKIDGDRLTKEQKEHMAQVIDQGGKAYEIRSLEQFIDVIERILE